MLDFETMRWILFIVVAVILGGLAYIRFAPPKVETYHIALPPQDVGDYPSMGGFVTVRQMTTQAERVLPILDEIIRATPRTRFVAGSFAEKRLTYETRSPTAGFPDYTTVDIIDEPGGDEPLLRINARLRFGRSDFGVNRARVEKWLKELGLLTLKP